jgi:hypothetical protein
MTVMRQFAGLPLVVAPLDQPPGSDNDAKVPLFRVSTLLIPRDIEPPRIRSPGFVQPVFLVSSAPLFDLRNIGRSFAYLTLLVRGLPNFIVCPQHHVY